MLRMKPIASAAKAEGYYAKSDGGYYLGEDELHREWGGKTAARLGLEGTPEFEHFRRLIHGLHPTTGGRLTARLDDDRVPAWDVTASIPKSVTVLIERGDDRVRGLLWEANRLAMGDLEAYATTRVRQGGRQEDRVTGNLCWYSVEHPETRPVLDEFRPKGDPSRVMPDPDRHIHNVLLNVTYDESERAYKAVKFRPIMEQRKYFDRRFDMHLAGMLADAGYEIETEWRPDGRGGVKYHTWSVAGVPESLTGKFSRRTAEVDAAERQTLEDMQEERGYAPERLSVMVRDKLGATSRREKREDLTLDDYRQYWNSRVTDDEGRQVAGIILRALRGEREPSERTAADAAGHAIRHHFEQLSVVDYHALAVTAMEHGLGVAKPQEIERELVRQGVLRRQVDGAWLATTDALMREEDFMVGFAAGGRGAVTPVGVADGLDRGTLNDGQLAVVEGLLASSNRVNLVEGPAGAGKSYCLQKFDEGMRLAGRNVTYLATTSDAAGVLAKDGFAAATVARFLVDEAMQGEARGGHVVVDEASMLGHRDAVKLFTLAERLDVKLVFVGDPLQHGSVPRGALPHVLKEYAGVQPFRLTEIRRQADDGYRDAVQQLSEGRTVEGFDALDRQGWVREIASDQDRYTHLAADYVQAAADGKSVLIVSPTHREAEAITAELRSQLRAGGMLGEEDRPFVRLTQVNVSEAERARLETYRKGDVLVFHQNGKGGVVKGQRIVVDDPAKVPLSEAAKFSLYRPDAVGLAEGERVRFTGTVKTLDGRHTLKNGMVKTVAGFTEGGDIRLDNGWIVAKEAGHFRLGWVDTSFASQGKTVDRVLIGMAAASAPAMNQEQMYVSASRGKEKATLYTDSKEAVRDAVQRSSQKAAALDLRDKPRAGLMERLRKLLARRKRRNVLDRMRAAWERQERTSEAMVASQPDQRQERQWRGR